MSERITDVDDPAVQGLLSGKNHAVVSTLNEDGSIHSTVVWVSMLDGQVAVNSAVGRTWPSNLGRNPTINVLVYDETNPYDYVEVRGMAEGRLEGADEHIDALAKTYLGKDEYPFRQPGEQRISFLVTPSKVRHQKQ